MQDLQPLIDNLQTFAQKRLNFERPPKLFLKQDEENGKKVFGKTAFYDPQEEAVTLFTSDRHPKDILRSLAHELVHHTQNLRGDLSPEKCGEMGMGYAQDNPHMREMEREAYERGNLCFRDWEDGYKKQMKITIDLKENKKMTVKISRKDLKGLITKLLSEKRKYSEPNELGPSPSSEAALRSIKKHAAAEKKASKARQAAAGHYTFDANRSPMNFGNLDHVTDAGEQRPRYDQYGTEQPTYQSAPLAQFLQADDDASGSFLDFRDAEERLRDSLAGGPENKVDNYAASVKADASKAAKAGWDKDIEGVTGIMDKVGRGYRGKSEREAAARSAAATGFPTTTDWKGRTVTDLSTVGTFKKAFAHARAKGMERFNYRRNGKMSTYGVKLRKPSKAWSPPGQSPPEQFVSPSTTVGVNQSIADAPIRTGTETRKMSIADLRRELEDEKLARQKGVRESRTQTPESEKVLNESMFGKKNDEIFNRLKKLWAK